MGPVDDTPSVPRRALNFVKQLPTHAYLKWRALHPAGKLAIVFLILFYIALGTFIVIVRPARIAQFMYDLAQRLSHHPLGWLMLGAIIVLVSFPPAIGHTTCLTLCGFAYGMKGFYVGAGATMVGAALSFIILRLLFARRLRKWSSANEKWMALESVIHAKGLPLIILIRMSPFPPWVYSNALFASIASVKLWQFVIATFFVFPKVALGVFIGSRAAKLADGEQREKMDTFSKLLNTGFLVGSILISVLASVTIYRQMQAHIRHLSGIDPETDELAAEAIEEAEEGAPLLRSYSDETIEDAVSVDTIRPPRAPIRRNTGDVDLEAGV